MLKKLSILLLMLIYLLWNVIFAQGWIDYNGYKNSTTIQNFDKKLETIISKMSASQKEWFLITLISKIHTIKIWNKNTKIVKLLDELNDYLNQKLPWNNNSLSDIPSSTYDMTNWSSDPLLQNALKNNNLFAVVDLTMKPEGDFFTNTAPMRLDIKWYDKIIYTQDENSSDNQTKRIWLEKNTTPQEYKDFINSYKWKDWIILKLVNNNYWAFSVKPQWTYTISKDWIKTNLLKKDTKSFINFFRNELVNYSQEEIMHTSLTSQPYAKVKKSYDNAWKITTEINDMVKEQIKWIEWTDNDSDIQRASNIQLKLYKLIKWRPQWNSTRKERDHTYSVWTGKEWTCRWLNETLIFSLILWKLNNYTYALATWKTLWMHARTLATDINTWIIYNWDWTERTWDWFKHTREETIEYWNYQMTKDIRNYSF